MNQTEAARRIGVHFVTIYAWENERRGDQPSDANLARAAKVYRTTAEDLKRRAAAIEKSLGAAKPAAAATNGTADAVAAPSSATPNETVVAVPSAAAGKRKASVKRVATPAPRGRPVRTPAVASSQGSGDRAVVSKVLRVLADVADKVPLTPETLNAAQRALLAPAFIDVFAAFKSGPMSDEDINAAFDATGAAVVGFVERRGLAAR